MATILSSSMYSLDNQIDKFVLDLGVVFQFLPVIGEMLEQISRSFLIIIGNRGETGRFDLPENKNERKNPVK